MNTHINAADVLLGPALSLVGHSAPAIIAGDRTISYPELDALACRAGGVMVSMGVASQDRVLLVVEDRPEFFVAYLGAMKIGAVPVAINLRISPDELGYMICDSECKLLVADMQFLSICVRAIEDMTVSPPLIVADGASDEFPGLLCLTDLMEDQPEQMTSRPMAPDDMAFWMYTSGTTGKPKAVIHVQKSVPTLGRYLGPIYGVGPGDRIFCSSKLFFAFSLGHVLFAGLQLGASVILHTGWPSASAIADVVELYRPTVMFSVPVLYHSILNENLAASAGFAAVRHYISAGEHLPLGIFRQWQAVTGHAILEGIGASEAVVMFIANQPDDFLAGSTGKPLPGTDVRLVDDDEEPVTGPGIPGVLWVRCDSLASGYWRQDEKTRAAFVDGWYCTGDVFIVDPDGYYYFQGRADDMLKISGQWVSPGEIEDCVLASPDVAEAAVVGVQNAEGFTRLALCLVAVDRNANTNTLQQDLGELMSTNLSIYKCPRRFVFLNELPKTASGKMQRFKLRQIAADYLAVLT